MKKISFSLVLLAAFFSLCAQQAKSDIGTIEFISPELSRIIKKDAKVEIVADGFQFTEGPVWLDKEKMVLFSDVPANTIYKWTEAKGKVLYLTPSGYTHTTKRGVFMGSNALALSKDGKLLVCQHGDRRIAFMDAPIEAPKPNFVTVAGAYNGKRLNSPNDFFLAAN